VRTVGGEMNRGLVDHDGARALHTRTLCSKRFPLSLLGAIPGKAIRSFGLRAYSRALWMQQHCREAQTYFGATIECDLSDLLQRCIYHFGVWEPHISALIESRLRSGDIFCDVGANIGYDSLLGSSVVGPAGKVIAIEASPTIYGRLLNNLRLNRVANVEAVHVAITAEPGEIPIYKGHEWNSGSASIIESRGHELEAMVRGLPLLDALSAEDRKHLRLVKIDVEGAELPILRQLADSIGEYSAELEVIVEVTPDAATNAGLEDVFDRFRTRGFSAWAVPNSYDVIAGYLNFDTVRAPSALSLAPTCQQDVFFSRSYSNGLGSSPASARSAPSGAANQH
jgi:FkbM family methyltransferase